MTQAGSPCSQTEAGPPTAAPWDSLLPAPGSGLWELSLPQDGLGPQPLIAPKLFLHDTQPGGKSRIWEDCLKAVSLVAGELPEARGLWVSLMEVSSAPSGTWHAARHLAPR